MSINEQTYPEPTVGALIFDAQGRLLLIRSHKWLDRYVVPGGHVELGESMEVALRREVAEETGLRIHSISFLLMQEFLYDPAYWKPRHFLFFDYACRTDETDVRLNDEAQEHAWATPGEALLMPIDRYTERAIRTYQERLGPRFVHTNLIAHDWHALAGFYESVFACVRVPPERDLSGPLLDAGTGLQRAHLRGIHLRLPGYEANGPTLEIYSYENILEKPATAVNRPGFGHVAFSVPDVAAARDAVLGAGGRAIGEIVTIEVKGGGHVTWCYMTDPEGNAIELQAWDA